MASKTARELRPAHGDLQAAVLVMALRYGQAHADQAMNNSAADEVYYRCKRTTERRFKALARLTAALANR